MTDIHNLMHEFWRISADEVNGESIFAMCRVQEILRRCLEVCLFLVTTVDLADKI